MVRRCASARVVPVALVTMLTVAGCSRSDDPPAGSVGSAATTPTTATTPTSTAAPEPATTPSSSGVLPAAPAERCADVPDPVDYPAGRTPPAIRPCAMPSELVVHTIRPGIGRAAQTGDTVIIDYSGIRSATGEIFDSTYLRDIPEDFVLGRDAVIQGWTDGLIGATAGSVVRLDMPAALAYGNTPPGGGLQAGDAVTFTIEVRAVIAPVAAEDAPIDVVAAPSVGATEVTNTDIIVGDGALVEEGVTAVLHLLLVRGDNLAVLVSTWADNDPLQVIMAEGNSLPGVREGIAGARVGGMRVITMPPDDAFGPTGEQSIGLPAGTDLIVVATVVGVY